MGTEQYVYIGSILEVEDTEEEYTNKILGCPKCKKVVYYANYCSSCGGAISKFNLKIKRPRNLEDYYNIYSMDSGKNDAFFNSYFYIGRKDNFSYFGLNKKTKFSISISSFTDRGIISIPPNLNDKEFYNEYNDLWGSFISTLMKMGIKYQVIYGIYPFAN